MMTWWHHRRSQNAKKIRRASLDLWSSLWIIFACRSRSAASVERAFSPCVRSFQVRANMFWSYVKMCYIKNDWYIFIYLWIVTTSLFWLFVWTTTSCETTTLKRWSVGPKLMRSYWSGVAFIRHIDRCKNKIRKLVIHQCFHSAWYE